MSKRRDARLSALGSRIAQVRKTRKFTQEAVAERSALSWKYISEIERGNVNPSIEVLWALATALGTSAAQLVAEPNEIDVELTSIVTRCPPRDRSRILRALRAFALDE